MTTERELAERARAWPFQEARKLIARLGGGVPDQGYVLFETGYGPSGLPHIGTFAEVVRTNMVRQAFRRLSEVPTRLIAFSDDMDGLRKVPDNLPNPEMLAGYVEAKDANGRSTGRGGVPLTEIPDPFGDCHQSFGHHNNAKLREFMDSVGVDYEFLSATECYQSGRFDRALMTALRHTQEILDIVLPELGRTRPERRKTYFPFLPRSPVSGRILEVPAVEVDADQGAVVFRDEDGKLFETEVTGGKCKLQWRVDWAMRWAALGVDYEMSGKDLIDSVRLSGRICQALGGRPPEGFTYELFLDENGEKISKSRGNGLGVEEWLTYGPRESLALFMYAKPRAAKRLYFDVIPRAVDDYLKHLQAYPDQAAPERLENPAWHIHDAGPPREDTHLSFAILMNLAGVCHAEDPAMLWRYISRYDAKATPQANPVLDRLVGHAIAYYRDFVKPNKRYRAPDQTERSALGDLATALAALPADADAEALQTQVYEVGKRHSFDNLRDWFRALYEVLMGQSQGPRFGSFVALYGRDESIALIRRALAGEDLSAE